MPEIVLRPVDCSVVVCLGQAAAIAGQAAVRGARPLNYNHYKVPLLQNLVKRTIRGA